MGMSRLYLEHVPELEDLLSSGSRSCWICGFRLDLACGGVFFYSLGICLLRSGHLDEHSGFLVWADNRRCFRLDVVGVGEVAAELEDL